MKTAADMQFCNANLQTSSYTWLNYTPHKMFLQQLPPPTKFFLPKTAEFLHFKAEIYTRLPCEARQ